MLDKIFDPSKIETEIYQDWENKGCFSANPESDKPPYVIMMPPPNVTGNLHMGHALNTALQDILVRYNRMIGKDVLWQPGTDHAGIATQMVVERKLSEEGTSRRDLGREAFVDKVWEWKELYGGNIINQFRKLGATPDWSRERFTMDEGLSKAVRKIFVRLYNDGLIYRDKRLVNWDPKLQSAVSDLEVESKDTKAKMWHIRYQIEDSVERFITIATTRPETMLGDTAIAVHPDDPRYQDLIGKFAVLPIVGRLIPIVADEYADPEQGSGAVKITPAHDFNDFEVGKRHNLEMINILDTHARINENAPEAYQGLDRYEARKQILNELEELDLLVDVQDIQNAVPYSERSGAVIEPFLTDQWYLDAEKLAGPAMKAVEDGRIEFVPKQWENTYFQWLKNIQPWCISRQLWWGHQIPAWYGPDKHVFVAEHEEEAKAQAAQHYGEEVTLHQDDDVLDTWFSSQLWPFSTLGWPDQTPELQKYYPGDVLLTGFDIIFFWVARMVMTGLYIMDDVPFRHVYMHALVRDSKGQKMSKSKGNVIDPLELIEKYGTDALRFTLTSMAAQGRDIRLSEQRIEGYRNFATKLWNAARYCQMNGCVPVDGFDPQSVSFAPNRWIVHEAYQCAKHVADAIESYRFNDCASEIYQFAWGTFCDWYLEITKSYLGEDGADDAIQAEIKATTAWALDQILIILSPIMPFVTEALYRQIASRPDMLIEKSWPAIAFQSDPKSVKDMGWMIRLITEIRSLRADMNVPAAAKIRLLVKDASQDTLVKLKDYADPIQRMARLEAIDVISTEPPKGSVQAILDEATLALPIADIIDLDKERVRLRKEIEKLQKELRQIEGKLGNEKFIANAPQEVIDEQKSRQADTQNTLNKLSQALEQLEAA